MEIDMPKRILILLIMALFLLAACSGAEQITPTEDTGSGEEAEAPMVEVVDPDPTKAPEKEEAPPTKTAMPAGPKMECTVVGDQPAAPPEYEAVFGVTDSDWVKGSETPALTIVEYSDFQ
jgi:hypothetical protein